MGGDSVIENTQSPKICLNSNFRGGGVFDYRIIEFAPNFQPLQQAHASQTYVETNETKAHQVQMLWQCDMDSANVFSVSLSYFSRLFLVFRWMRKV